MSRALVAWFSASGVTEKAASVLAEAIGADRYEIRPKVPYTQADLDWMDKKSRSSVEMDDPSSRPELADCDAPIAEHDVILIGFPIWWYTAPSIIKTFLEVYDFGGKTIALFATSGGSGLGNTAEELQKIVPDAVVRDGMMMNGKTDQAALKGWANRIGE